MSIPTNRSEFREYCLRRLGHPVVQINVNEEQVQDRIDEALSLYHEHHFDATEILYLQHKITAGEQANTYIDIPDAVRGVTKIWPVGTIDTGILSGANPFNAAYQLRTSDMYSFFGTSMIDYYMYKRHATLIEEIISGQTPIRFNKHMNRLYIDGDWKNFLVPDTYIVIQCYRVLDPNMYPDIWHDDWLLRFCTELIRFQWGTNMSKYKGMKLPGGTELNGLEIMKSAEEKIEELKRELRMTWEEPPEMFVG